VPLPRNDTEWAREYEVRYRYACYLYYHAGVESPLTDDEFDRVQAVLARWWDKTSDRFRAAHSTRDGIKTEAHALELSSSEKKAAVAWAERRSTNPLAMALPEFDK